MDLANKESHFQLLSFLLTLNTNQSSTHANVLRSSPQCPMAMDCNA